MTKRRAVVIGGSIAGLCAARVLADYFDTVTVLDRDVYPAGAVDRAGVPQSRHVHALLAGGRDALERLFPGFATHMRAAGALDLDFGLDFAALRPDGWLPREESGIRTLFASRTLLESIVRDLVRAHPRIELVEHATVTGLVADGDGQLRTRAVRLADGERGADLIVDASGRTSKAPEWMRALGLDAPDETVVDSFAGYATRWFQAPDPARWPREWWWKAIWLDPKVPEQMTAGVLFPLEGGRWIVTLAGLARHYPPSDEAGFTAALGTLRSPIIAEAVRLATPISPVYCNRAMANRFRHYDRWRARLDGFLAIGDSVCAFNPVYGQGMTTAALSAGILRDALDRVGPTSPSLPREFFRAQAGFLRDPWGLATGADFMVPGTEGARPWFAGLANRYMEALFTTGRADPALRRRIGEVIHMVRRPAALFELAVVAQVARDALGRLVRPAPEASVPSAMPALQC